MSELPSFIETSQLINAANQLTGFYIRATLTFIGLIIWIICDPWNGHYSIHPDDMILCWCYFFMIYIFRSKVYVPILQVAEYLWMVNKKFKTHLISFPFYFPVSKKPAREFLWKLLCTFVSLPLTYFTNLKVLVNLQRLSKQEIG